MLAAFLGLLWWTTNQPVEEVAPAAKPAREVPVPQEPLAPVASVPDRPHPLPSAPEALITPDRMPLAAAAPAWENQIDQVLQSSTSESQAAQTLINMLPTLPEEGQAEAARHITNLLDDKDYKSVQPILLNPNMPEEVLSIFFTDLMNRSDAVKLRAFVEVAKVPAHPFRQEALSDLQIYLDQDYGTDLGRWSAAVEQYLRENPEPEEQP